jgi:hypothetical protein
MKKLFSLVLLLSIPTIYAMEDSANNDNSPFATLDYQCPKEITCPLYPNMGPILPRSKEEVKPLKDKLNAFAAEIAQSQALFGKAIDIYRTALRHSGKKSVLDLLLEAIDKEQQTNDLRWAGTIIRESEGDHGAKTAEGKLEAYTKLNAQIDEFKEHTQHLAAIQLALNISNIVDANARKKDLGASSQELVKNKIAELKK